MHIVRLALFALLSLLLASCDGDARPTSRATALSVAKMLSATAHAPALTAALASPTHAVWMMDASGNFVPPSMAAHASSSALRVRLPATAEAAFAVGAGDAAAQRILLSPRGADAARGSIADGHVVYPAAYGADVDLIVTRAETSMEQLFVLRSSDAPHEFSWDVALPSGVRRASTHGDGSLHFEDAQGRTVVRIPRPYAIDAEGARRDATLAWDAGHGRLDVHLDIRDLTFPLLLDPAFEVAFWEPLQAPSIRTDFAMAYDAVRGVVVLFGGKGNATFGDTWTWDGRTWTPSTSFAISPAPRSGHSMVFDAARQEVILFGGADANGGLLADTWRWDGASWTALPTAVSPRPRNDAAMMFDATREQVVLFGGVVSGVRGAAPAIANDTWLWDGTAWTEDSPAQSPSARSGSTLVFDSSRRQGVLFGGFGDATVRGATSFGPLADTWLWDGGDWSLSAPTSSPSPRGFSAASFDAIRGNVVLFGGALSTSGSGRVPPPTSGETWTWDGSNWTQQAPRSSPGGTADEAMVFNPTRGTSLLFGTAGTSSAWEWDGSTWFASDGSAAPAPRAESAMAKDAWCDCLVLFGGFTAVSRALADTWSWNGKLWTNLNPADAPPARFEHMLAYDSENAALVLFGGLDSNGDVLGDTWTFQAGSWTQAAPVDSPSARAQAAMTFDATRNVTVLFGGLDDDAETWTWDGTDWTQLSPPTSPPGRRQSVMSFDPLTSTIVLFGGKTDSALGDTWTWDGTTWTQQNPATAPPPRADASLVYDAGRQRLVLFGGTGSGSGALHDTWSWDGSTWTEESEVDAPAARSGMSAAYDPVQKDIVLFGGTDAFEDILGDTWLYTARAGGCSSGADCDTGFCVDGTCCGAPSCGTCQTCNGASTAGTCASVVGTVDPDTCSGSMSCDANGACKAASGQMCTSANDCASGFCADGFCCNTACDGTCMSCSARQNGGKVDGTCGPVAAGTDPKNDCTSDDQRSCENDGFCDGKGACQLYTRGVSCGASQCSGTLVLGLACDGLGSCESTAGGLDCTPYACDVALGQCNASCTTNEDCATPYACQNGRCVAVPAGGSCDGAHTVTAPNGSTTDCSPYKCEGSTCRTTCASINDCALGTLCNGGGQCVTASAPTEASGCNTRSSVDSHDVDRADIFAGLFALAAFRARRRRHLRVANLSSAAFRP